MKSYIFSLLSLFILSGCHNNKAKEKAEAEAQEKMDQMIKEAQIVKDKAVADSLAYVRNLAILDSIDETKVQKYVVKKIKGRDIYDEETSVRFISYRDKVNKIIRESKLEMLDEKTTAGYIANLDYCRGGLIEMNMMRYSKLRANGSDFKYVIEDVDGVEISRGNAIGEGYYIADDKWFKSMSSFFPVRKKFPLHVYIIDGSSSKRFEFKITQVYKKGI